MIMRNLTSAVNLSYKGRC